MRNRKATQSKQQCGPFQAHISKIQNSRLRGENIHFEEAVAEVISVSPVRYTSALLEKLSSLRTQDFVKQRVRNILQTHQDVPRRPEILRALHGSLVQPDTEYPQWEPKKSDAPLMIDPVTDYVEVYRKSLSDKDIAKFSAQCTDEILISLISDISDIPKRNAIRVVEYRKEASVPVLNVIKICMKSAVLETAHLAMQVMLKLEKNEELIVSAIIEAMKSCESDEMFAVCIPLKKYFPIMHRFSRISFR